MLKRNFFLVVIILFGSLYCSAQVDLRFYHINTKGYRVNYVYRDANNIMWVGSSFGLFTLPQLESRNPDAYDRHHQAMKTGIDRIYEDNKGCLWMVTHHGDVLKYDPKHNDFTANISKWLEERNIIVTPQKFSLYIEGNNNCMVWQDDQLYTLNLTNGKVQNILLEANNERVLTIESNRHTFVVLTTKNLYFFASDSKRLLRKEPLKYEPETIPHIVIDDNNNVWLSDCRYVKGYHYRTEKWVVSEAFPSLVSAIACGPNGKIWVGQENHGIYICDKDLNIKHHLKRTAGDPNGLKDNQIYMLHHEKESGTMWVGYSKGDISIYNNKQNYGVLYQVIDCKDPNAMTDVLSFAQTPDGKHLWMGLEDRGIYYRNLHTRHWTQLIDGASVSCMKADSDGSLWAGLYKQGLLHMLPSGQKEFYFKNEAPYALAFGSDKKLFVALQGKGVWCLDMASGKTTDTHISASFVFDLKYQYGRLHAVSTNGYYTMNVKGQWKKVTDGRFRHGCIDRRNYAYLLGEANHALGLTVITPQGKAVELPTVLGRTLSKNAALDKADNLWAVSGDKLVMLRLNEQSDEKWEYKVFNINTETDDIFYNYRAIQIDQQNHLWLGTDNGYQYIDLNKLLQQDNKNTEEKPIVISSISINDEIISPNQTVNGRVLISCDVIFTKSLDLNYNENNILVECASLFEEQTKTDTYYYKLKGLSDTWLPIENHSIILSNLAPGRYQLYTKAQNSLESHMLDITIAPPLWRSWWASILYLVALITLGICLFRYYSNKKEYKIKLRELELQQEQEKHLNEVKLRFFTNISHDLRTPLSLIIGPVEDLESKAKDKAAKSMLEMIHRNADLLLSLVNQILDFRRLEFGNEKLIMSYGDLVPMIGDLCETFKLKAKKDGIELKFLPEIKSVETQFDKDKITKIMMNLLVNAFKFSKVGGVIAVGIDASDDDVIITVSDTGIGIPDEDKPLVFERFYQSKSGHLQAIGSGIGLHIVREYVHLHGGEITIRDNQGGIGTVFTITLPLHKETESAEQNEPNHERTILVIDDNSDFLTYVGQGLSEDYNVISTQSPKRALEILQENDVEVIISDVMMDEMDGLELCRTVKSDITTSHIPVILLTAKSQSTHELEGLEAGADDYITKPFSMDILLQRIHNLIERSQQKHQRFKNEIDIEPSEITVTSLDEQLISKAIALVEEHMSDSDFNVEELSNALGVHRSQLYKKLQHLTGRTPIQFIRLLRLKRGKQLLEQSGLYVSEIAYQVGFNSPRVFSKYFKAEFGMTPEEYKK